jgi:hypothetical protein
MEQIRRASYKVHCDINLPSGRTAVISIKRGAHKLPAWEMYKLAFRAHARLENDMKGEVVLDQTTRTYNAGDYKFSTFVRSAPSTKGAHIKSYTFSTKDAVVKGSRIMGGSVLNHWEIVMCEALRLSGFSTLEDAVECLRWLVDHLYELHRKFK